MHIPLRRSLGMVLAVLGLLGPLSAQAHAQLPANLNPYVNPLAGQGFGFLLGAGLTGPAASLTGYGLGMNQGMLNAQGPGWGGHMGYGSLMNGGAGGYGLSGGLASNLLSGAGFGWGYGYGMSMGNTQWMMNPYQGYLQGAADITKAQSQYFQTIQQAKLTRQEAIRSSIETRRAMIEEAEWERAHAPDPEKIRQQAVERELNRARVSPPLNDVWSARSLNALLRHLITLQGDGVRGPRVALSPDIVKHLNVRVGDSVGNIGLLKNKGELDWPESLIGGAFKEGRERVNSLMKSAFKSIESGSNPDPATLLDLQAEYRKMLDTFKNNVADLEPAEYIEANRFLKQIGNTITALKDENIGKQFNGDWKPKSDNVAGLVKHMREKGLLFAPATDEDQAAYVALYHALAAFDAGMQRVAGNSPENPDNK